MRWPLVLLMICTACATSGKDDDDDDDDDAGSARESGPYVSPDNSNCTADTEFDRGADGDINYTKHWVYGDDERLVAFSHEDFDNGDSDQYTITYLGDCQTGYHRVEVDEEGEIVTTDQAVECDAMSNWLSRENVRVTTPIDGGEDETVSYRQTFTNTYDGDLLIEQTYEDWLTFPDDEDQWVGTNRKTFTYDTSGRVTTELYADAETDEQRSLKTWTWYADDKPATYSYENNGDEPYTDQTEYEYDADGRNTRTSVVSGMSGVLVVDTREWDPDHYRSVRNTVDYDGDGVLEGEWIHDCEGDFPWGCSTTVDGERGAEPDPPHDGTVDHTYTLVYACTDG
jgi:hypothetical protein